MAGPRHKAARPRPSWRPFLKVAVPIAAVATVGTVGTSVALVSETAKAPAAAISAPRASHPIVSIDPQSLRVEPVSRSERRVTLEPKPEPEPEPTPTPEPEPVLEVADRLFVTTPLNVWTGPGEDNTLVTVLDEGVRVGVTGRVVGEWAEIVHEGEPRYVRAAYLTVERPEPEVEETGGISQAPCPSGSEVEAGLTPDAVRVHRAVCAQFPEVTSYGGVRSDGTHAEGRALDIMVSGSLGDQIAEWVRANAGTLGVSEVIWSQQIWTVERSSEGWRYMEDRGSTTANHYDHVHVTVYGDSGG